MPACLHLYTDDSGTRTPDRHPNEPTPKFDYFAMGGVLVAEADEEGIHARHAAFCREWGITYPLHSVDLRHASKAFSWLRMVEPERREAFYAGLHRLIADAPIHVLGCVVDRPGYSARYRERYGRRPWHLCKTAFTILLERAARVALERGMKLRVFPERCSKRDDRTVQGYYDQARAEGMPFDPASSAKYQPLTADVLRGVLYDFKCKDKSSPLVQLADLVLYPVARQPYDPDYLPYRLLRDEGKLLDCILPPADVPGRGIKYSCFDRHHADSSGESAPGIVSDIWA